MFEFITISGGVAVVQHEATGYVYRFRPAQPGVWSSLSLDKVDPCPSSIEPPQSLEHEAQVFAERAAEACCRAAAECAVFVPAPTRGRSWIAGRNRNPVR